MDKFDFQLVLIAVILGLAIAELLTCVSHILLARHRTKVYWVHLIWMFLMFMLIAQYWHALFSWRDSDGTGETFFAYLGSLTIPVAMYVSAAVLGPNVPPNESFNFREYYYDNHRGIFFSFAFMFLILTVTQTIKMGASWVNPINLVRYGAIFLMSALAWWKHAVLHATTAFIAGAMLVTFVLVFANH